MSDAWTETWEVMYAPFPAERDDCIAWDNKMNFWVAAIRRLCQSRKSAVFSLSQLPLDFQRHGHMPQCLGAVVQHMVSQGLVRRLSFIVSEMDPEGSKWSVWDFFQKPIVCSFNWFVRNPTNWIYRKLFSATKNESNNNACAADDEPYVIVELVKCFAEGIHDLHRNLDSMPGSQNLIGYKTLLQMSKEIIGDESSFRLGLLHLSAQNRCSITTAEDGQKVVRLVGSEEEFVPPSSTELKLFRLKTVAEKLETSIDNITQLTARYKQSAKESLNAGNRNEAVKYLKRKKQLEPALIHKELALDRIFALITALEQTESHKQVLDAYRSGIEAFKNMKKDFGLSVDEIDKTMLNMQETFDDSHELERTMSLAFNSPLIGTSEDDLERELNELLDSPKQIGVGVGKNVGSQLDRPSTSVASSAVSPRFTRSASPGRNADKAPIKFPDVPSDDSFTPVTRRQHANRAVTIKFGRTAKKSLADPSDEQATQGHSTSKTLLSPRGVANECEAA